MTLVIVSSSLSVRALQLSPIPSYLWIISYLCMSIGHFLFRRRRRWADVGASYPLVMSHRMGGQRSGVGWCGRHVNDL